MAIDPQAKLPANPNADDLDKAIYSLMPDRYGDCDRQRSHNRTYRNNRRVEIIKAVKDMINASNTGRAVEIPST